MDDMNKKGQSAKQASKDLAKLSSDSKNKALEYVAENIIRRMDEIIEENKLDIESAKNSGISSSLIDRLTLNKERIESMALGIKEVAMLDDPVGEVLNMKQRPNGLMIGEKRVPLGVVGIIYEARPNVTADAFALCFKTGNATLLRGGKEAIRSNKKIVEIIQDGLESNGFNKDVIQLVEDTSRESSIKMMKMHDYLDVLIPRGGKGLIKSVVENSTVPIIETGAGNCHIYIDKDAHINKAIDIIINAKVQRPGVCNALETLLVHKDIATKILPEAIKKLQALKIEVRGDSKVELIVSNVEKATDLDWSTEYLDNILAIKIVEDFDEAIKHIDKYSTGHSEAIVTENYTLAQSFLNLVDSAAVYVNASTRFTDGSEFGFGAEIGISTQKLHARGPMGLKALTSTKYIIYGDGQIRK